MRRKTFLSSFVLFSLIFFSFKTSANASTEERDEQIRVSHILTEPVIDGRLDDEVWKRSADVDELFKSYLPTYGESLPYKTKIWLAHDSFNLYFAFHCHDSELERIKSSITRRDDMWEDDWIGLMIDTMGSKKFGYGLCANPIGIQGDAYESSAAGLDFASDYVWYSAGRIVEDGYIVEMKIPLDGFKYKNGENVEMNIIFIRQITRLGIMSSLPAVPPGQSLFAGMATVIFDELKNQTSIKTIPSLTYGNIWDRKTPSPWSRGDSSTQTGITAGYRVTSSITTEATINPDFSQVESDEFQVLVNQRYPIFYSEKRPFFMEASKMFDLAGSGSSRNFISAVHTRKIVDPTWGAKIGGDIKAFSFGALVAADSWPGSEVNSGGENQFEGEDALFLIGRSKLGIGSENYIGSIFSIRNFSQGYNRTFGGDLYYRFGSGNHFLKSFFLHSISKDPKTPVGYKGSAFTLSYVFNSMRSGLRLNYEYLDDDFRMDTAFIRRVGISKFSGSFEFNIYPNQQKFSWIKRISPSISGYYLHDIKSSENDFELKSALRLNFVKQGYLLWQFGLYREYWKRVAFTGKYVFLRGNIQMANWINLGSSFRIGDSIYYDPISPDSGEALEFNANILLQATQKLTQYFQYVYQKLNRKHDGQRLYDVNILISRTTYQINKYLFLRAIIQYDSNVQNVLTDALVSFTLIPGSVIHLGYGGLHESLRIQNGEWMREGPTGQYYQTKRSVFFKISYLFQF